MTEEGSKPNPKVQLFGLIFGPILALFVLYLLHQNNWSTQAQIVAAVTTLCAVWWMLEPIPIPITSLLPVIIFPMTGAINRDTVAKSYGDWLILLLMGGFIISKAMEKSGTHRRLAFILIKIFGGKGKQIVFGFMAASTLLSMWISNTATTLMLLPIALAILSQVKDDSLNAPLLLGICYSCSIGGMGTPIGTPPNAIFVSEYKNLTGKETDFLSWMKLLLPLIAILIPALALQLTRKIRHNIEIKLDPIGKWRQEEIRTLLVFLFIALSWILRTAPYGGWSKWLNLPNANDADVALLGVALLFLIPNGEKKGEKLLDWQSAVKIPWDILLLFSGGLIIANAFRDVGLSTAIGKQLANFIDFHPFILILIICLTITFLTEITSNAATALLLLPILGQTALMAKNIDDPAILMIPATISTSCAFMLPIATPPNAIIFGSGKISIKQMAKEGFILNVVGAIIISVYFYFTIAS